MTRVFADNNRDQKWRLCKYYPKQIKSVNVQYKNSRKRYFMNFVPISLVSYCRPRIFKQAFSQSQPGRNGSQMLHTNEKTSIG